MKVQIMGVDECLEFHEGIALLNIHNKELYRSITNFLYNFEESRNDILFLDDEDNTIEMKRILYINDLLSYKFDNKQILEKLFKPFIVSNINADIETKEKETLLYKELLEPIKSYADLLEIDYDLKEELDNNFYLKIVGFDYSINDSLPFVDKMISVLKLSVRLYKSTLVVVNRALSSLTNDDLVLIEDFCKKNSIVLLLIDYLDDSEVVITNNLVIGPDFSAYKLK